MVVFACAAPFALLGCSMLNLGQTDSSSSSTGGTTTPSNANLGDFTLKLKMTQSSCGQNVLGLQDQWSFDVTLAHQADVATWTSGGATIQGVFDSGQKTVDFTSSVTIDMRKDDPPGSQPLPACSIERADQALFDLDSVDHPKSVTGELSYTFGATSHSNCADLVYGQTPKFTSLPCRVTYSVTGAPKVTK